MALAISNSPLTFSVSLSSYPGEQLPQRVERSFSVDEVISDPDHPEMTHSTSAHDLTSALRCVKEFWGQIDWSNLSNPKPHLAKLIDVSAGETRQ